MTSLLLFLNKFFKARPHPFNMEGADTLNYYNFEYESAPSVFADFETVLGKKFWNKKSVCDFGCGAGGKSIWLKETGAREVVGVDLSETLISQAKKHSKQAHPCTFRVENICTTTCSDDQFDIVIANDVMEHVNQPFHMLEEAYRILKPGGILCINFEPYYHFLGHHMWDVIHIPWAHVLFSEQTRIDAYEKLVAPLPDGQHRIHFRIDTDSKGRQHIGYLNHITLKQFKQTVSHTKFHTDHYHIHTFQKPILKLLGNFPLFQEFLCKKAVCILKKPSKQ